MNCESVEINTLLTMLLCWTVQRDTPSDMRVKRAVWSSLAVAINCESAEIKTHYTALACSTLHKVLTEYLGLFLTISFLTD